MTKYFTNYAWKAFLNENEGPLQTWVNKLKKSIYAQNLISGKE